MISWGVASKSKPIAAVRLIGLFLCVLAQTAFGLAAKKKPDARRWAFFWSGWRDYSMISWGGGLKVKAHRRCAAHRSFFMHAPQTAFGLAA